MSMIRIFSTALVALLLVGCADIQNNPKQAGGTLVGAGLGALAGSQIGSGKGQLAAVAIGTLAGAFLGSEVGKSLDKADKMYAERTTQNALEYNQTGQPTTWRNPDTGHTGTTVPTRTFKTSEGQPCREFESKITVKGGKTETVRGTACRQADGTWRIVQ